MSTARRTWLTRNLLVLSGVSLLQDTASEMLFPILPIFLTTTLGAPVVVVGVIEGLADGAASLVRVVSGRVADRAARRPLVAAGYGGAAAGKVLVAAAVAWPMVLVGRVVDRIGKGVRGAPRDAMIADATPATQRGRAFGFHRAMDTVGAVVGPLLGLALYHLAGERIRPVLWIATVPALASVAMVALVREQRRPAATGAAVSSAGDLGPHGRPLGDGASRSVPVPPPPETLPPSVRQVVAVLAVFAVVNFSDALILLRAEALGLEITGIILAYCLFNLVYAVASYPAGAVSDRIPRRTVVATGLGVFGVSYLGLGLAGSAAWVWVLLPLYGGYAALTEGVVRAWLVDLAPRRLRGRALGLNQGLSGAGMIVAGVWAGLAWGDDGQVPFLVAGVVGLAVAVVVGLGPRRPSWR